MSCLLRLQRSWVLKGSNLFNKELTRPEDSLASLISGKKKQYEGLFCVLFSAILSINIIIYQGDSMRLSLIASVLILVMPSIGLAMDSDRQLTDQELLLFPKIMPPADILEKRLRDRGLDQFVDHSNVIQILAGSSKDIIELSHEIGYIVMGYASYLRTQPNPELERVRSRVL